MVFETGELSLVLEVMIRNTPTGQMTKQNALEGSLQKLAFLQKSC